VPSEFVPSLPELVACSDRAFSNLSKALRTGGTDRHPAGELQRAIHNVESDLARMREKHVTVSFTLDRVLPFWSFVFNLRELAQDLQGLAASVGELA
jgi:hypothetical protein